MPKSKCNTDSRGNKYWYNAKGDLHRDDGPAYESADGTKAWWVNGKCHREDGPAIETADGLYNEWFIDGRNLDPLEVFLILGQKET